MTARAHAMSDNFGRGVRVVVSPSEDEVLVWQPVSVRRVSGETLPEDDEVLHLRNEYARALYEALAQHFGGNATDMRNLRADYDAERKRVDKMIDALIKGQV